MTDKLTLYTATVEFSFHVAARSQEEAQQIAIDNAGDAFKEEEFSLPDIAESRKIECDWSGGIPYSAKGANPKELTVEQILRGEG